MVNFIRELKENCTFCTDDEKLEDIRYPTVVINMYRHTRIKEISEQYCSFKQ